MLAERKLGKRSNWAAFCFDEFVDGCGLGWGGVAEGYGKDVGEKLGVVVDLAVAVDPVDEALVLLVPVAHGQGFDEGFGQLL